MTTFKIDPEKIREVIGRRSVIQKIVADSGATVILMMTEPFARAVNAESALIAKSMIDESC